MTSDSNAAHPLLVPGTKRPGQLRLFARRWLRRSLQVSLVGLVLLLALWIAAHRIPGVAPALADGLRSLLGPGPVAWMEDVAYGIQDRVDRWRYDGEPPKTFWEAPPAVAAPAAGDQDHAGFFPEPFAAPYPQVATPADGIWVPIADPHAPDEPAAAFKSMVHPDPRRTFAALAVVAIDTSAFELHLLAGTKEPLSYRVRDEERPGLVPAEHSDALFAAFNGGFKATHGNYGMMLDGVEFLPPQQFACTFARYRDGRFRIAPYRDVAADVEQMSYYRQTPPCLVEGGEIHDLLNHSEYAKNWGATVSGETVIRRSAIGLSGDGKVLFYGLGEAMTAQALARGMKAAGADWVAELDVNHSYPRFLLYQSSGAEAAPRAVSAIIPGIDYSEDEYVTRPSPRDFFYLTRNGRAAALDPPRDARAN